MLRDGENISFHIYFIGWIVIKRNKNKDFLYLALWNGNKNMEKNHNNIVKMLCAYLLRCLMLIDILNLLNLVGIILNIEGLYILFGVPKIATIDF